MLKIEATTKIFGCIADPVDHVKAPTLFTDFFNKNQINAVMVPLNVTRKDLGSVINGLKNIKNFVGLTVTIPHKIDVLNFCDELDIEAKQTGAVNWIKFDNKKTIGNNFDGMGFVDGLRNKNISLENKSVCIFGAGGAGIAISFALQKSNLKKFKIVNRDEQKAQNLVKRLKSFYPNSVIEKENFSNYNISDYDIIINATSIGLKENKDLPFEVSNTKKDALIADIIMEPEETMLIKHAKMYKKQVHLGKYMLESQISLVTRLFNF